MKAVNRVAVVEAEYGHAPELPVFLPGDDGREVRNGAACTYHERVHFPDRPAVMAERSNARAAAACPLFAEDVRTATADQYVEGARLNAEQWQTFILDTRERALAFRAQVAAIVPPEVLAALDARRRILPACCSYGADFWREQAKVFAAGAIPCYRCGRTRETPGATGARGAFALCCSHREVLANAAPREAEVLIKTTD